MPWFDLLVSYDKQWNLTSSKISVHKNERDLQYVSKAIKILLSIIKMTNQPSINLPGNSELLAVDLPIPEFTAPHFKQCWGRFTRKIADIVKMHTNVQVNNTNVPRFNKQYTARYSQGYPFLWQEPFLNYLSPF